MRQENKLVVKVTLSVWFKYTSKRRLTSVEAVVPYRVQEVTTQCPLGECGITTGDSFGIISLPFTVSIASLSR